MAIYANIIVNISIEKLDKSFQYKIPKAIEEDLLVGMQVEVPFGNGNRKMQGFVTELTNTPEFEPSKMKEITRIVTEGTKVESRLIALAGFIKTQYGCTMNQALKTVLPVKEKVKEKQNRKIYRMVSKEDGVTYLKQFESKHQVARLRLMAALLDEEVLDYQVVLEKLHITASVVDSLAKLGILRVESETLYRNPIQREQVAKTVIELSEEQRKIVNEIWDKVEAGELRTSLIHGVTGSGKTEVYIEIISKVLREGKEAIVLIPEIALTFQTVSRFYQRFGNQVSILHSRLSKGERYDQLERAKKGEIKVMIGPRSALFTPFQNLGIIVIDEEHEGTYKSEKVPRYHARETAIELARMSQAFVVLGSATPSMDSYYRAKVGEYDLYELASRVMERELPETQIIDLREELASGNRSILSTALKNAMSTCLEKKEQIILFLNRRGFAGFVSCRACGHVLKCPHCDISLSLHKNKKMVCHYCGYETAEVKQCPECSSKFIGAFRAGTQQVVEVVQKEFPQAKILRMDFDTTRQKDGYEKILSAFANEEADILIGTQMIVKGHDFKNVTLVGVLAADLSLHVGDYRASERTFQLLTQAVGRAGRGKKKGSAIIQTYDPEHYCIQLAASQNYEKFYQEELTYRQLMNYPPVSNLVGIYITSKKEEQAEIGAATLKSAIDKMNSKGQVQVIGPSMASVAKVNDQYRFVIYLKCEREFILIRIKEILENWIKETEIFKEVQVQFDKNPMNGF